jgi:hypothetical protein
MNKAAKKLNWRAHPAKERTRAAVVAIVVILSVTVAVYISLQSMVWSLIALTAMVVSLNHFLFPSRFTIDNEGITARYFFRSQRYSWESIRRFFHDQNGGYLSTRSKPSRLDAYRGMHIQFGEHKEAVVRKIREHLREGEAR